MFHIINIVIVSPRDPGMDTRENSSQHKISVKKDLVHEV